ncbi:hypothetical protein SAMD00024442_6_46 [Candidatus Symbiothrix dinenymphae]|nr:hypothetical protein SAMD00024442_6_46 [Candidatus Symbiothrix dinenymphae]
MTISQQPHLFNPNLLADLKDIVIRATDNVVVTFQTGGKIFLTETYAPDNDGVINIREMSKLLSDYIPYYDPTTFTISMKEGNSAPVTSTFLVLYSTRKVNTFNNIWLKNHFLTATQRERIICPNQLLQLCFYADEPTSRKITIVAKDGSRTEYPSQENDIGLSWMYVDTASETTAYIIATAGSRSIVFYVAPPSPPNTPQFWFRNSFGQEESFIPFATTNTENKYENNFGTFNGDYKKYNSNFTKEHTTHTGVLTEDMADWLEDLFVSKEVYLLSPYGSIQHEITITDVTVKKSTAPDFLPSYEFKWRLSEKNHLLYTDRSKTHLFTRPPFDTSFN